MEILPDLRKAQHWRTHPPGEDIKCDEFADRERPIDHQPRTEIQNPSDDELADQLDSLACRITEADDTEACGNIAGELLLPAALHLRLDGHGL